MSRPARVVNGEGKGNPKSPNYPGLTELVGALGEPSHRQEERNGQEGADKHRDDPEYGLIGAEHETCNGRASYPRDAPLKAHKGIGSATNIFRGEFIGKGRDDGSLNHLANRENELADAECNSRCNQWQER